VDTSATALQSWGKVNTELRCSILSISTEPSTVLVSGVLWEPWEITSLPGDGRFTMCTLRLGSFSDPRLNQRKAEQEGKGMVAIVSNSRGHVCGSSESIWVPYTCKGTREGSISGRAGKPTALLPLPLFLCTHCQGRHR
jgi:hypothetical protein